MNKKFLAFFAVLVIGILGFAIYQSKSNSASSRKVEDPKVVQTDDHIYGNAAAKVYMITYGDYECPACNAYEPSIKELREEYKDKVAFIFRNFPLTDKHVNAKAAARAAEAANLQGKFWEMHDLLYEKTSLWAGDVKSAQGKFESYAEELGLDMVKFIEDYKSDAVADRIDSDASSANKVGATGTPTFLVNGVIVETGSVAEGKAKLKKELDAKLSQLAQ